MNSHDRPLSFYPFTNDKRLADMYITRARKAESRSDVPAQRLKTSVTGLERLDQGQIAWAEEEPETWRNI